MGGLLDAMIDRLLMLENAQIVTAVILWFVLAVVAGALAGAKGHNGGGYFILAVLLSPLIGLILASLLDNRHAARVEAMHERVAALEVYRRRVDPDLPPDAQPPGVDAGASAVAKGTGGGVAAIVFFLLVFGGLVLLVIFGGRRI